MNELKPVLTAYLFPVLDIKLIELLRQLSEEDWARSALPRWTVKDVAAHLLDSNVRRLSMGRDGYWGEQFAGKDNEFVAFLNGLNADWVKACRRLSPKTLVELLRVTGQELSEYVSSLDPNGQAVFGVSWAGEAVSLNWFDIAREYTEKWHHQQQIRDAVDKPGIMTGELYTPVIATFMRCLPFAYRGTSAKPGTAIQFRVTGECGGEWILVRNEASWELRDGVAEHSAADVAIPGELTWKLFTKGLPRHIAERTIRIGGDKTLGNAALSAIAIVG
jgi:uncharacterized protein (TIGR03083 family)